MTGKKQTTLKGSDCGNFNLELKKVSSSKEGLLELR